MVPTVESQPLFHNWQPSLSNWSTKLSGARQQNTTGANIATTKPEKSESSANTETSDLRIFAKVWGFFLLVLILSTYPLWFVPPSSQMCLSVSLIPSIIPMSNGALVLPSVTLLIGLIIAIAACNNRQLRIGWMMVAGSLLTSFLIDQHRLQPWAYQSLFYALILCTMNAVSGRKWIMLLAASVYVYSAAGKFDFQFQHTVGQDLLRVLAKFLGGLPFNLDADTATRITLLFPTVELLAGLGLYLPTTRRLSVVVVVLMHISLLILLGPWGLNHSRGVLLWNLMLMAQAYLLFWVRPATQPTSTEPITADHTTLTNSYSPMRSGATLFVKLLILLAIFCPLFERSGYWDHWASWSLYSPHTSRAEIELHRSVRGKLDSEWTTFLEEDEDRDGWQRLSLESMSLGSRFVPIYPQARYQLAIANQICSSKGLDSEVRVKLRGVADRWTGKRSESRLIGQKQIQEACKDFWLNTGVTSD